MARKMSFDTAMDLVPDDLSDGAFFAMAHEMAGLEYGEGFYTHVKTRKQRKDKPVDRGELVEFRIAPNASQKHKPFRCMSCGRRFRLESAARCHWTDMHSAPQEPADV